MGGWGTKKVECQKSGLGGGLEGMDGTPKADFFFFLEMEFGNLSAIYDLEL